MNVSSVSPERCEIDRAVAGVARDRDRVERLGQRPDLVELDQDRVRDAALDPLAQDRRVGDEDVVADELQAIAEPLGELAPAIPVALRHPVLEGQHRVALGDPSPSSRPSRPSDSDRPSPASS